MDNVKIITLLYSMGQLSKEDIFNYVCEGKITTTDYKAITQSDCPELPLDIAKKLKKEEISSVCKNTIYGGFTSTAHYGTEKTFGSSAEDQFNISGNSQAAISKESGVPACQNDKFYYHASGMPFEEWTAAACIALGRDFKEFRETQLMKSKMIQDYVDTLDTSEKVLNVTWDTQIPAV